MKVFWCPNKAFTYETAINGQKYKKMGWNGSS